MVFSSPIFLFLFFPLCLIAYCIVNRTGNTRYQNICLLIFSIIFYAYGSLSFLPILLISIVVNFVLSRAIHSIGNTEDRRLVFVFTVAFNVILLFIYKYANLFTATMFGADKATHITLPIGISFYTFQVLSYICDVYNKKVKPCDKLDDMALFTMLFPQLIAGPIVRYSSIEKQMKKRKSTYTSFYNGLNRFMRGFIKKIIFANTLGRITDIAFSHLGYYTMGFALSIFTILCYSIQIYLDFWAYSDMAIGIGEIFGFTFPENFNMPFASMSITEFWTRWHITLSTFFRDYVYIPLGGSRKGLLRTCINLTIVFALSGFWHGAGFNFLFWGFYNALFLVIERILTTKYEIKIPKSIGIAYVFIVWTIGMIFFRIESINDLSLYFVGLFSKMQLNFYARQLLASIFNPSFVVCFIISILYLTPIFDKIRKYLYKYKYGYMIVDTVTIVLFAYAVIDMLTTNFNPFIYFRF